MVVSKKFNKILILRGGISDELEISRLSANHVYKAIKHLGDVSCIDVTYDCKKLISNILKIKPNIIFNCLHGYFGEDGQVQSILNFLKIPYTHSGVLTSAILMNKVISKQLFKSYGIETPNSITLPFSSKVNFPVICKPINGGSSNGLSKINNHSELKDFLKNNKEINNFMFEEYIPGRELTVGILNNKICGIMEIKFYDELYDYKNKYINIAKHIINPKLPNDIKKRLCETSLLIHNSLNCNCISRLDFRYNEIKKKIYLLEVNTQPGLTENSLLPEMAKNSRISFLKLCKILMKNNICEI